MIETHSPVIAGRFINTGSQCNLNCMFCPAADNRNEVPFADVRQAVAEAGQMGYDRVILAGGEPTIRKDIVKILNLVTHMGLKPALSTNGRMFAYDKLVRSAIAAGLDSAILWLHAPNGEVHDSIVRSPGAFSQTADALRKLANIPGFRIELKYALVKQNAGLIGTFLDLVEELSAGRPNIYVSVLYPEPVDNGDGPVEDAFLPPDEAARVIRAALADGRERGLTMYCEGMPECFLADLARYSLDRRDRDYGAIGRGNGCTNGTAGAGFTKVLLCAECGISHHCRGIYQSVVDHFGFEDVSPFLDVRSNSFDYTFRSNLEGFTLNNSNCQGYKTPITGEIARNVFLVRDETVSLYHTDTGDFSPDELYEIKHVFQQLYLDISDKMALDDYQKDVKQLRIAEECRNCDDRGRCPLAFRISEEVPFYREERWLKGEIGRMQGRVLDVGCGDLRYQSILSDLVDAGKVEYHGLDPDREALSRLRRGGFKMTIHTRPIEDFEFQAGYFDYVLMLRSINHFRDLDRTFDVVRRVLRNYGIIIIADCIPFALLRSREKACAAHTSLEPEFEHYRNFTSQQVLAFLRKKPYPFKINIHRPVMHKTANLWLLKLIKIEEDE